MILRVYKHYGSARTLSKQLRYNHLWVSLKTYHGEKSAVIMMGIVIGVFVITYGMYLHCSFLILFDTTGMVSCNDVKYKFPVLVLNSAINPLAYAFFKRDVNKEFRRLISINMFLKKGNQVKPSTYVFDSFFFCLPRDFVQKAKSRGKKRKEIPRRRLSSSRV